MGNSNLKLIINADQTVSEIVDDFSSKIAILKYFPPTKASELKIRRIMKKQKRKAA